MNSSATHLLSYIVGGVTLPPLIILITAFHFLFVLPRHKTSPSSASSDFIESAEGNQDLEDKLARRNHEPDVAAGYFAVCREYVPGGVNGKPPERTSLTGQTVNAESPSVYQSMYRSIFDRGKTQAPSLEIGKNAKKGRNVFYVVLRYALLLTYSP